MTLLKGFPGGSVVKTLPFNSGDAENVGLILGSGRPPGVGNGTPLQYSCLGNPMDRGACLLQSMGSQTVGHDNMHARTQVIHPGCWPWQYPFHPQDYALTTPCPHPHHPNYPSPPCLSNAYKKEQRMCSLWLVIRTRVPSLVSHLL